MNWKQHKDVVTQENKDGSFLLHMDTGIYFGLDPVGSQLWSQLKEPKNLESLTQYLIEEFEISKDQAQQDSLDFIENLRSHKLVVES